MKNITALLFLLTISFTALCQPAKIARYLSKQDAFIMTLSSDNWLKLPAAFDSKPIRSRGFSLYLMNEKMDSIGVFGIGYGIGFSSQNVHTNAFISDSSGQVILTKIPDSLHYSLNKTALNFIDFAFELRFHSHPDHREKVYKLSVGIKGGYLLQSHTKYEDDNGKIKTYGIKELNKFQYGITGRIGYSKVALSMYYSLIPVFKKNHAPEMTVMSVGIGLAL